MEILTQPIEGLVLIGEEWACLRYCNIVLGTFKMNFLDKATRQVTCFIEGKDYEVDYEKGLVRRREGSTIPDGRENVFFGMDSFNHILFEKFGNDGFTLYAEYSFCTDENLTLDEAIAASRRKNQSIKLSSTIEKLKGGFPVKYVVFGDSISTGAEASSFEKAYFRIFSEELKKVNPKANVMTVMKAIGGEDTEGAILRFGQDVVAERPDLVTIAYGMNDQNKKAEGGHFVEPARYEENIEWMVQKLVEENMEVVLITPCLPNPCWVYTSGDSPLYAEALRRVGKKYNVPVADVQEVWVKELEFKKSHEALLMNNINHPNEYGHYIYGRVLCGLV